MNGENKKQLDSALARASLHEARTNADLISIFDDESRANQVLFDSFYQQNPILRAFMELLDSKTAISKDEYSRRESEFFNAHPEYKDQKKQHQAMEAVRSALPEGALLKVTGGYALLATERRSGRSPAGTFPVNTPNIAGIEDFRHTKGSVTESEFDAMWKAAMDYMDGKKLYSTKRYIGQGHLAIPVHFIGEKAIAAGFTINMFRGEEHASDVDFEQWTMIALPGLLHPNTERFADGVFKFTNYRERIILIGGSGYNGEIKKGMFAIANHVYPLAGHLSFHCSSVYNEPKNEITLVFGLSGTGKSTVASGLEGARMLSDDETGIDLERRETFNLENGNYYKTGGLLSEPKVLAALENVRAGDISIYENVVVSPNAHVVFAADPTANGRVSLPLTSLPGAVSEGMFPLPKRIIILSRDVHAVLDPANFLSKEQIVYYLNLGYTSKTPGTEAGITKPIPTYSKWEGGPFYDLKDEIIMKTLLKFLSLGDVEGVLLNSGEGGGPYGTKENSRFPVAITLELARAFVDGVITAHRDSQPADFDTNELLGTVRPKYIPGISEAILKALNAKQNWTNNGHGELYDQHARELFAEFTKHAQESLGASASDPEIQKILESGPRA